MSYCWDTDSALSTYCIFVDKCVITILKLNLNYSLMICTRVRGSAPCTVSYRGGYSSLQMLLFRLVWTLPKLSVTNPYLTIPKLCAYPKSCQPGTQYPGSIRVLDIHQVIPRVRSPQAPVARLFTGVLPRVKYEYNCLFQV